MGTPKTSVATGKPGQAKQSLALSEVTVSTHRILSLESTGRYYITGTTDLKNVWEGKTEGFHVFSSQDLVKWRKVLAWAPPEGSQWDILAWGAVIVPWNNRFVMLGAVASSKGRHHSILSMISDTPEGPYILRSSEPVMEGRTKHGAVDPTHVLDADGTPWLVIGGSRGIFAAPLSKDLMRITAKEVRILHNSDVHGAYGPHDGLAFHRLANGHLLMFYSADYKFPSGKGFATFKLRSATGNIVGPWVNEGVFLPRRHGLWIWRRLDGQLMLTAKPKNVSIEKGYPGFAPVDESETDLSLVPLTESKANK